MASQEEEEEKQDEEQDDSDIAAKRSQQLSLDDFADLSHCEGGTSWFAIGVFKRLTGIISKPDASFLSSDAASLGCSPDGRGGVSGPRAVW